MRLDLPKDLAEEVERICIETGSGRQKVILKALEDHFSLLPVPSDEIERGFDSIMERQFLRMQLEKKDRQIEELRNLYEVSVSITRMTKQESWWVRLRNRLFGH
jgi:hypothetical protein